MVAFIEVGVCILWRLTFAQDSRDKDLPVFSRRAIETWTHDTRAMQARFTMDIYVS